MKAYTIAMFLFLMNLSFAMFSGTGILGSAYADSVAVSEGVYNYTLNATNASPALGYDEEMIGYADQFQDYEPTDLESAGGLLGAIIMVITAIANSTALLPFFLNNLGMPDLFNAILTGGCWFCYGYGILQFVTNRADKTMR